MNWEACFFPRCCQSRVFKENITVGKNTEKVLLKGEVGLFFVYFIFTYYVIINCIFFFTVLDCFWKQNRQFEYLTLSYGGNFLSFLHPRSGQGMRGVTNRMNNQGKTRGKQCSSKS